MNKNTYEVFKADVNDAAKDRVQRAINDGVSEGIRLGMKPLIRKAMRPYAQIFRAVKDIAKEPLINEMAEHEAENMDFEDFYEETIIEFRRLLKDVGISHD